MISRNEIIERAIKAFGEPTGKSQHEYRFGAKHGIVVQLTGEKAGLWYSFGDEDGGSLLTDEERPDFNRERRESRRTIVNHEPERIEKVRTICDRLTPIEGTRAEAYLESRAITRWPPFMIGYDPVSEALVGKAVDQSGAVKAVQRVFLDFHGQKRKVKAGGSLTAKVTTKVGDDWYVVAACRLPGRGSPILCEGLETGLSIWMATSRPVFVCFGNAGFDKLMLPAKRLTIARDGDAPGSPADERIIRAATNRARRKTVYLTTTPVGQDFNSIHQTSGLTAVESIIRDAARFEP